MPSRGNPNWGKPDQPLRSGPTEFDMEVKRLGLTPAQFVRSRELQRWCAHHRNQFYVPEWLLKAWGIDVDSA